MKHSPHSEDLTPSQSNRRMRTCLGRRGSAVQIRAPRPISPRFPPRKTDHVRKECPGSRSQRRPRNSCHRSLAGCGVHADFSSFWPLLVTTVTPSLHKFCCMLTFLKCPAARMKAGGRPMGSPRIAKSLPLQVAAICYRRRGTVVEFLLVNTNGGNKWTFPKGSPEARLSHSQAAEREAAEEAGALGTIAPRHFHLYIHSKGVFWQPGGVQEFA